MRKDNWRSMDKRKSRMATPIEALTEDDETFEAAMAEWLKDEDLEPTCDLENPEVCESCT